MEFEDEVDVPSDLPALERFARYRGLKSFRTSPWDPKESLPSEYSRIFQFEDFSNMQKQVIAQARSRQEALTTLCALKHKTKNNSTCSSFAKNNKHNSMDVEDSEATSISPTNLLEGYARPGTYICLEIRNVPRHVIQPILQRTETGMPLLVSGLLEHEQRTSVLVRFQN
eukprot:GSMAST32.ASY1.ANO1.2561.1 assembled CDS